MFNVAIGIVNSTLTTFPELASLQNVSMNQGSVSNWTTSSSHAFAQNATAKAYDIQGNSTNIFTATFNYFNLIWRGFILVVTVIVDFFGNIVFGVQRFIEIIFAGVPGIQIISIPLQGVVWVIYALGFMQWYSGRGFREYQ